MNRLIYFVTLAVVLFAGSIVQAQVVLNGDSTLTEVTSESSGCQCANATTVLETDKGTQTLCALSMSIPVTIEGPGRATFSYSLFGNAIGKHDGVNAWISLSPQPTDVGTYIAAAGLSPAGVADIVYYGGVPYSGGSWIGHSETLDFTTPTSFTAYVNVAFNRDNQGSAKREKQQWGCFAPKVPTPSYLKIMIEPLP